MVDFPITFTGGLNLVANSNTIKPDEATVINNFELTEVGSLSKVKGLRTCLKPNSNSVVLGVFEFEFSGGLINLVVCQNDIYQTTDFVTYTSFLDGGNDPITKGSNTNMGGGLGTSGYGLKNYTKPFTGVSYKDYFIMCNGEAVLTLYNSAGNWYVAVNSLSWNDPENTDDETFAFPLGDTSKGFWNLNYSTIGNAIPRLVTVWNNKLVFTNAESKPYRIWLSGVLNFKFKVANASLIENFGFNFEVSKTGDPITGCISYLEQLIILKSNSIFSLTGFSDEQFRLDEVKLNTGNYNINTVVPYGDDIYFINEKGLTSLNRTDVLGTLGTSTISEKVAPIFRDIAKQNKGAICRLLLYKPKDQLWIIYSTGSTTANSCLIYHPLLEAFTKRDIIGENYTVFRSGRIISFTSSNIYELNVTSARDGSAIQCDYETGWLGDTLNKKRILNSTFLLDDNGAGTFTYEIAADWNDAGRSRTIVKRIKPNQFILGVSRLGTGTLVSTSGNYTQRLLAGSGNFKSVKLKIREVSTSPFQIDRLNLQVEGGSMTLAADN